MSAIQVSEDGEDYVHIGEVVLSYERAIDQARDQEKEPKDEIALLLVHGILHLFGYDHAESTDQQTMWKLQEFIVNDMNAKGIL